MEVYMNSFVYIWTNNSTGKKYVGYHKGTETDGYVCSSKNQKFWDDYKAGVLTRKIVFYGTMQECIELESKIIKSEKIENLYNRNLNGKIIFTEDLRKKLSTAHKGRKQDATWLKNRSDSLKGRIGGFIGKTHSEETLQKMSNTAKSRKKEQCRCCGKVVATNTLNRWHNDNCKENKNVKLR
jgi:hypothetical protein